MLHLQACREWWNLHGETFSRLQRELVALESLFSLHCLNDRAMEYEKCYVFEPENARPSKRRRIAPHGLQASWKLRQAAYRKAWETQRQQLEQNIQVDVRNSLQFVRTAEARLRSAAIARENSAKQYDSEQRKLDAGQSDIYRVLERQTALTTARSSELRAQTELNKAIADLQRATGNSLKANNVEARLRK